MVMPAWRRAMPSRPSRFVRPRLEVLEDRHLLSVFTVTTVADGGPGSLRQAILDSDSSPGQTNTIDFAVAGSGAQTIAPLSPLPAVTTPTAIDGTSQPGFAHSPLIDLNGANAGAGALGLTITAGGSTVRGLAVNGFSVGVYLATGGGNLLDQDYVGTDVSGGAADANAVGVVVTSSSNNVIGRSALSGNTAYGVLISQSSGNQVGSDLIGTNAAGTAALANGVAGVVAVSGATNNLIYANVLSGNGAIGVLIDGAGTTGNQVFANNVGVGLSGAALGNGSAGVAVAAGASGNTVGGAGVGAGNVVSANGGVGVFLYVSGPNNVVEGNRIGTDGGGATAVGNATDGVQIAFAANNSVLGNVISGNGRVGVLLGGDGTTGNVIAGNKIGTNAAGSAAVPNAVAGVFAYANANGTTVGGTTAAASNVISGNTSVGIEITGSGSSGNLIAGNLIGTNAAGTAAIANGIDGVIIDAGAPNNTIGGTMAPAGNVISGNTSDGIQIGGPGNLLEGNRIGTNAAGTATIANQFEGVDIAWPDNTVGGTVAGAGNVISGNGFDGLFIDMPGNAAGSTNDLVEGNFIGTDGSGTAALPNHGDGVFINADGGNNNTIGGTTPGAGNVISGNADNGIQMEGGLNVIEGNRIGTNAAGTAALPNGNDGILDKGDLTTIGPGNVISGNALNGVELADNSDLIIGNLIGTNAAGTAALANGNDGIFQNGGVADATIGGTTAAARNVISGNTREGIQLGGPRNLIEGNYIGTNAAGTAALGNGNDGVLSGTSNTVGGTSAGAGNLISGNAGNGVNGGALIEGNKIGTNASGTAAIANGGVGVLNGGTVGGTTAGAGNLISGNTSYGVQVLGVSGSSIQGNDVGTEVDGVTALANGDDGVFITSLAGNVAANNTVGGNVIAFNHGDGVLIGSDATFTTPAGTGNQVTQNSIFGNTQIGIDLGPDDGVTPNDSAGHSGPNNFQDFPVITSAFNNGGGVTTVNYSLTVTANVHYTVEFFVSPSADPSGFGQGKTFVGSAVVFSSVSGTFPQQANLSGNFAGQFVTATATDASGNTSEFSNAFQVSAGG
jgi:titin